MSLSVHTFAPFLPTPVLKRHQDLLCSDNVYESPDLELDTSQPEDRMAAFVGVGGRKGVAALEENTMIVTFF